MMCQTKTSLLAGCAIAALLISASASAQDNVSTVEAGTPDTANVITVTSTRINREGYDAPTPTTVIGPELIRDSAQSSIATTLNQLPSLGAGVSPGSSGNDVGSGSQGANFLNLRGLGTNRTLVLLDNRRVVSSAATGQVDINLLPTTLVRQVEVVTGGASAAWGSDAVAGVVNFTLETDFEGFKGELQHGISQEGDAHEMRFDVAAGTGFAGGRGHLIASFTFTDSDGVDRADSRDWFRGTKVANNPAYTPTNGQPLRITLDNTGTFLGSDQGHVIGGPLAGIVFNNDGTLGTFDFGTRSGSLAVGSTTLNDLSARSQLRSEYEQISGFLRGSFDVTENLNVYAEFMYGKTEAQSLSVPYYRFGGAVVARRENAFLPAAVAQRMDAAGVTTIPLALTNFQLGRATPYNEREIMRYVAGADYEVDGNWIISAYYQHGDSNVYNEARNNAITANYALAVDAVFDGQGNAVCRSTLTNPGNGCAPLNVFGNGVASQSAIDYIIGTAVRNIDLKQDVAALTIAGDLFDLPAGPVSIALGGEYRKESLVTTADPISQANGFWVGNYKNAAGGYNVAEGFAEIVVPVFRDSPLGEALDLNGAIRLTDYSTSGLETTYKLGATYDIGAGVRLRGTISRDIRGPNLNEFFDGGQTNSLFFDDPFVLQPNGAPSNYLVIRTISGNPNLEPEQADSYNLGVVFQPTFLPRLRLAIDYFNIDITGAIGTIADNQIPQRCFNGEDAFCALITRDTTTGLITRINNSPVNFAQQKLSAFDFEASYSFDVGNGDIDLRTFWTYTDEHSIFDAGTGRIDYVLGEIAGGNAPGGANGPTKWKGYSAVSYASEGGFRASLRHRFVGAGVLDANWVEGVDIDENDVPSVHYFDLSLSQSIPVGNGSVDIFASVDNLLDQDPPRAPLPAGPTLDSLGVSNTVHDLIGRYFRAGVRFDF